MPTDDHVRRVGLALALPSAFVVLGLAVVPRLALQVFNPRPTADHPAPSPQAAELHASLAVADLHGDALLWDVGLLRRRAYGHVDVPRLVQGRVALQAFTVVTKAPRGQNIESTADGTDLVTWLAVAQLWPPRTWRSLLERALHQAKKLHDAASASGGQLVVVRNRAELDDVLGARDSGSAVVAAVLGLEGAHALEGSLAAVDRLHAAGFRSIGLTHFLDNEVGGSAHGLEKGGLTEFGRRVVGRMEQLGIAADLAHAAPTLIDDVLDVTSRPVLVSHSGVSGTCDNRRNLADRHVRGVAATGGVVGIGLWPGAVCGESPAAWARAVRYAVDLVGPGHVALGSDWDGAVPAIVDAAGTVQLVEALLQEGLTPGEIRGIMGENIIRVLRETLPAGP